MDKEENVKVRMCLGTSSPIMFLAAILKGSGH